MKKIRKLLCLLLIVGLVAAWAAADSPERRVKPDEVVEAANQTVKGAFELDGNTYYMGMLEGSFSPILAEDQYEDLLVQIDFYTSPNQGGQDGAAAEYQKVTDQKVLDEILKAFGDTLKLELHPVELNTGNGTVDPPEYWPAVAEENTAQRAMKLNMGLRQMRCWMLRAAGTIQGEEITATSILHWWPESQIYTENFSGVKELNDWLENYPWLNEEITYVLTLKAGEHTGQIVVPERMGSSSIIIRGSSEGSGTTLHGGITFLGGFSPRVESIQFVGAGRDRKTWDNGEENNALSGAATFQGCSFTGYNRAVSCTGAASALTTGTDSEFEENQTAIYYDSTEATGGNPNLSNNSFYNNGIAIHVKELNDEKVPMTHFQIVNNCFVDNATDIRNDEKRCLYLPGNYFGTLAEGKLKAVPASCLPVANGKWVSAYPQLAQPAGAAAMALEEPEEETAVYLFDLEREPVVSVAYAAQYPIPASSLPGKVITVMDADTKLAVLDFSGSGTAGTGSFDPTVRVQRDGESMIFVMKEACGLTAQVQIPCDSTWTGAAVTCNGKRLTGVRVTDGVVSFPATGGTYTITPVRPAVLSEPGAEKDEAMDPLGHLRDLDAEAWYIQSVRYCLEKGLMSGVAEDRFDPDGGMTRAMVWTVLGRIPGETFSESGEDWYAEARQWAMKHGISDGTNPNGKITREQLITMLWRFTGEPEADTGALERYQDGASVSSWAREAMAWGVANALVEGTGQSLMPGAEALRCQVAAIIMRYHQM